MLLAADIVGELVEALSFAFGMFWEILWALILGFFLSAVVQAIVSKGEMRRLLPEIRRARSPSPAGSAPRPPRAPTPPSPSPARSFARAPISPPRWRSCSPPPTLVIELGIIMWLLLGWQFVLGEFIGGPLMIVPLALLFRVFLRRRLVDEARAQADRGVAGRMEGHAEMDMSVRAKGSIPQRLRSSEGFTSTSHYFVMDWAAIWIDIVLGLLIAGALAAWVPESFWQTLFLEDNETLAKLWGPIVGPIVAIISFVCSIGNVPLAAVLWNGGISFGGVIAFIFADLIVLPILDIYRRYYGWRMAGFLFVTFFAAMAVAALLIELPLDALGLIPEERNAKVVEASVTWNYKTLLNIVFLALAALLAWRFLRTGGLPMLRAMNKPAEAHGHSH
jgi:uncharacterized membrane protein YraQ (UPF0718 family)